MKRKQTPDPTIACVEHVLVDVHLPRIVACLNRLSTEQIWWRPNEVSNSVGNLVLHLTGNVRQWIISGLGGAPDFRKRDIEFSERRRLQRRLLVSGLESTVKEACRVLRGMTLRDLRKSYPIQKFDVTGLESAFHVAEHFALHAGQIILLTKMMKSGDLKFTRLPGDKKTKGRKLAAW
jgi:hypothetical protein